MVQHTLILVAMAGIFESTLAQGPGHETGAVITSAMMTGSGCPRLVLPPRLSNFEDEGHYYSVQLADFSVNYAAGASAASQTRDCTLGIDVEVPAGYGVYADSLIWNGTISLSTGLRADFHTTASWSTIPGEVEKNESMKNVNQTAINTSFSMKTILSSPERLLVRNCAEAKKVTDTLSVFHELGIGTIREGGGSGFINITSLKVTLAVVECQNL